jgi:hypothetical protein
MPNNSEVEKRWACVKDGKVDQVIIWDGVQKWAPAESYTMVALPDDSLVSSGWDYKKGKFEDNRPIELEEVFEDAAE